MTRSRITAEELEDLRLSYDIPTSVTLRAPGLEERAADPHEGFVAIYEPMMQQGLRLPMHPLFREVVAEAGRNLSPREFESIYRPCRSAGWYNVSPRPDCGKPSIPKRDQGELRSKWDKVRALSSDFRSLSNLLKDDNLLSSCGLMVFRFKRVSALRLACPASGEGSSVQASRHEALGPSQEVLDATPSSTIPPSRSETEATVHQRPPSSSNLHIDTTTLRDKEKKVAEGTEEAPAQKRKAHAATKGLMRDARKARRTEEGRRSSPSLDGEPEGAGNSTSSAGQRCHIRISEHREELPTSVMEMLPAHPSIVAASVHRYWTPSWEKAAEEAIVLKCLQLDEMNLARDQRRAAEASQKRAEEAQKLAEDRTLVADTALATASSSLEAAAADNERSLIATKLELEKVRAERTDAEAKAVEAYQDAFVDTPEYQDLAQRLMTIGGEQLVERIMEAHPEWDISFLREAPTEVHASEADLGCNHDRDEGTSYADP
ncbi:hypothetical protein Adt_03509 [Abeliophyllum distichum]|uniref:Uncharacterized protein n=1 Tax=Abeliophyllum distichum TaxID=126358 RepID=A0ABD1VYU2_9LAMI